MNSTTNALFDPAPFVEAWTLADRFIIPPFSTIDTRSGRWLERRARWDTLDLDSTNGRPTHLTFAQNGGQDEVSRLIAARTGTVSTFDPVLAELIYRWWTPSDGIIYDPFAGGSVRGMVAGITGRHYIGVDLSRDQVYANRETHDRLAPHVTGSVRWIEGDSSTRIDGLDGLLVDAVISCPPYGTLERYSDDPRDLSTMKARDFEPVYTRSIVRAVDHLRDDRFAVFVVGNYRESNKLVDLVGMTVAAFGGAGADYYGDLVLLNSTSTAAIRASSSFNAGRKPIRVHQLVVVFVKGDWRRAAAAAERVDPTDINDEVRP